MHPLSIGRFAQRYLGLTRWSAFETLFSAVERGERKILIRSCNGAGKTTAIAVITNWMMAYHPESVVLTSAATHIQLRRNLWGEIRRQARETHLFSDHSIGEQHLHVSDKHFAIGISPAVPESAQGYHAPKIMIAVDEATALDRDIMEALLANGTGEDSQIILAYNPLGTASYPYQAERNGEWFVVHLSAFEHPNLTIGHETVKGAVTPHWVRESLAQWSYPVEPHSEGSLEFEGAWYRKTREIATRVLGEWPDDDGEGFFAMYLLERSVASTAEGGQRAMGVDVAHGGEDATVFAFFDGNIQQDFQTMRTRDIIAIAEAIRTHYNAGCTTIAIDDTGIGGGVTDILRSYGIPVHAVNFAAAAKGFQQKPFANARAEMYFILEHEVRNGTVKLLDDEALLQELSALRLDQSELTTRYRFEPKEDLRRRLGRSPDRADATALARYGIWCAQYTPAAPRFL